MEQYLSPEANRLLMQHLQNVGPSVCPMCNRGTFYGLPQRMELPLKWIGEDGAPNSSILGALYAVCTNCQYMALFSEALLVRPVESLSLPSDSPSPEVKLDEPKLGDLFDQLEQGVNANLFYSSLALALMVPSICGAMESDNGEDHKNKYVLWFNTWMGKKYADEFNPGQQLLSGADCYSLRSSIVHQGKTVQQGSAWSRIIFFEPNGTVTIHKGRIVGGSGSKDVLMISIAKFCHDMIDSAREWLMSVEVTANFKNNYLGFLRRYPDGIPPYITGVGVVS